MSKCKNPLLRGHYPITVASQQGHEEVVKMLLEEYNANAGKLQTSMDGQLFCLHTKEELGRDRKNTIRPHQQCKFCFA